MCGRLSRRQLVPPRRPRAPIDTHQAAGGRERPLPPGASDGCSGASRAGGGAGARWTRGGAPRGGTFGPAPARLLSASPGSLRLSPVSLCLSRPLFRFRFPLHLLSLCGLSLLVSVSPSLPIQVLGETGQPSQAGGCGLCPQPGTVALQPPTPRLHFLAAGSLGVPGGTSGDKGKARGTSPGTQDRDKGGGNEALGC